MSNPRRFFRARTFLRDGIALSLALLPLSKADAAGRQEAATSIAELLVDSDGDGLVDRSGDTVTVTGVLTTDPYRGAPGIQRRVYLQDVTGGIRIQSYVLGVLDSLSRGDSVRVTGVLENYRSMASIIPTSVVPLGVGTVPSPLDVLAGELLGEELQGRLVRLQGTLTRDRAPDLMDTSGKVRIFAANRFFDDPSFTERLYSGSPAEMIGIAEQMDEMEPFDDGYRILLVDPDDLIVHEPKSFVTELLILLVVITALAFGFWLRMRFANRRADLISQFLERVQRSEAKLKEEEQRLRVVTDATHDLIWDLDLNTGIMWRSADFGALSNQEGAENTVGFDILLQHVHPEDRIRVESGFKRLEVGQTSQWSDEFRIGGGGQEWKWVHNRARLLRSDSGEPQRVVGALVDVTRSRQAEEERQRLDEQMHRTQRLESLGSLAAGVAHDFNNILAGIVGNVDLAVERLPADSAIGSYLSSIDNAATRGAQLVNQMLTYAGTIKTIKENVDLNQVVEEIAGLLTPTLPGATKIKRSLSGDIPRIHADPRQVQQVVLNMLTNASDALEGEEGVVTVETGFGPWAPEREGDEVVVPKYLADRYVWIRVTDTGVGMDEATKRLAFDPFYTTKTEGRGLGMSAVLGVVKRHDGILTLLTEPNRGTTIHVAFPDTDMEESTTTSDVSVDALEWKYQGTALVVEDDEMVGDTLAELLKLIGFDVLVERDGLAGLNRFKADCNQIDVVVLDQMMPEMTGVDVYKQISAMESAVKVLMISGGDYRTIKTEVGRSKTVGLLSKPFSRELFNATLRRLFEH